MFKELKRMMHLKRKFLIAVWILLYGGLNAWALNPTEVSRPTIVTAVPAGLQTRLNLSSFYKKYVDANGLAVISSDKVSDEADVEAAFIVNEMLKNRPDIRDALVRNRVRVVVMAPAEQTTDIPEHSDMRPKAYWDNRARGLGATAVRPASSCAEENLLNLPGDRYSRESIITHEFAHTIHVMGLNTIDPTFEFRLKQIYQSAMSKGRWANTYAESNFAEYWAETVQSYFDSNDANNAFHNDISTHEKLAVYDPEIFALIDDIFHQSKWRYVRYDVRHGKASPQQSVSVRLAIVNNSTVNAAIYWMSGVTPKLYRTISPGQTFQQPTFTGHRWQALLEGNPLPIDFTVSDHVTTWVLK